MLRTSVNKRRLQITDVAAFADLSPADKRALRRAASPMTYPKGATIQEAGSIDRRLVVVVDGVVQLDDGSQRRECGPGTAFGDSCTGHFRLSFATSDLLLEHSIQRIGNVLGYK